MAEVISTNSPAEDELNSCSDSELLNRFCEAGDEAGFRAIVERHAAMVSSVCLSVLRNKADAEDAFQATFFVLARKARTVRERKSLAAWLHRVALRSALVARRKRSSRPATELPPEDMLPESELRRISSRAVVSALHEELDRLPEKYRTALIACYLEGASRKEAAQQLGITEAAVKTRLERARRMLRRRLGVLGFAAFSAAGLCQMALTAGAKAVSAAKVTSTVGIAMQVKVAWSKTLAVAAGNQASLNLAQGVLKTMMIATALKTSATALLGLFAGVFAMTAITLADDPPNPAVVQQETKQDSTSAQVVILEERKPPAQDTDVVELVVQPGQEVRELQERIVPPDASWRDSFTERVVDVLGDWQTVVREAPLKSEQLLWDRQQAGILQWDDRYIEKVRDMNLEKVQEVISETQELLLAREAQPLQAMVKKGDDGNTYIEWRLRLTNGSNDPAVHQWRQDLYTEVVDWTRTPPSPQQLAAQNKELKERVAQLEEMLKLQKRVAELEAANARLQAQVRELEGSK